MTEPRRVYDDSMLGRSLPIRITVLANLIAKPYFDRFQRRYGLLLVEWRVLRAIAGAPGTTQSTIAEEWGLNLANVNRAASALRKRGLITGTPDPADRRRVSFALTEQGADLFEEIAESARLRDDFIMDCLTPSEIADFERLVEKLTAYVREHPEPDH